MSAFDTCKLKESNNESGEQSIEIKSIDATVDLKNEIQLLKIENSLLKQKCKEMSRLGAEAIGRIEALEQQPKFAMKKKNILEKK